MSLDHNVQPLSFDTHALAARWDRAAEGILVEKYETIVYANKRYAGYFGYTSANELIGKHVSVLISPADKKRMLGYGRRRLLGNDAPSAYQFHGRRRDGAWIRLAARVSAAPEFGLITTLASRSPAVLDQVDFEDFYAEHAGRVYAILLRMLRYEHDAQDVLQESFLQAWRQRNNYEAERGSPSAWLNTIARSRGLDHLRAGRSSVQTAAAELPSAADPRGELDVVARIERTRLCQMLATLPESQRIAIELAYLEGYSQTEIALRLDIPLGTVKTRILLGMRRLRGQIEVGQQSCAS